MLKRIHVDILVEEREGEGREGEKERGRVLLTVAASIRRGPGNKEKFPCLNYSLNTPLQ